MRERESPRDRLSLVLLQYFSNSQAAFQSRGFEFGGLDICRQTEELAAGPMSYRQKKKMLLQVGKLVLGHWYYQLWHVCRMCLQPVLNVSCIMQWLMWSAAGGCTVGCVVCVRFIF